MFNELCYKVFELTGATSQTPTPKTTKQPLDCLAPSVPYYEIIEITSSFNLRRYLLNLILFFNENRNVIFTRDY